MSAGEDHELIRSTEVSEYIESCQDIEYRAVDPWEVAEKRHVSV